MAHIGVIPARGGSKRIPRKNIRPCAGRPLIDWTAAAALGSRLGRTILSTDDAEIADHGRRLGLEVPFLRPAEIASDAAAMLPVLQHLLAWLAAHGGMPASLVLLQPTSPLRTARHIDEAIAAFEASGADSLVSYTQLPRDADPGKWMRLAADGHVTRLERPKEDGLVLRNGPAILIMHPETVMGGSLYGRSTMGYYMEPAVSVDIDEDHDFDFAEFLLLRRSQGEPTRA